MVRENLLQRTVTEGREQEKLEPPGQDVKRLVRWREDSDGRRTLKSLRITDPVPVNSVCAIHVLDRRSLREMSKGAQLDA